MVNLTQINSIKDVKTFTSQLIAEGASFHPDDRDFRKYITKAGDKLYTNKEAILRNRLLKECFKICRQEKISIKNLYFEVFLKETGLEKLALK